MTAVAFLGSHPLGVDCLTMLADHPGIDVAVVVTYPPAAETWWDGSVAERATEYGYPILTTDEEERLTEFPVEYLLSVYYPNILGPELLAHPEKAPLNLHQAELPRYRGSNVFTHAILNARADDHWRYGTTVHVMAEDVDAGDIIERRFVPITETDTARSLYDKTGEASRELFADSIPAIAAGEVHENATPQADFDGERYFHTENSLDGEKELSLEQLSDPADERAAYDRIRALDFPPFEPAYTCLGGKKVYLTATSYESLQNGSE